MRNRCSDCTHFCTHSRPGRHKRAGKLVHAVAFRHADKEFVDCVGLRVLVPHRGFYAIVSRYILQGKGIRVGPRLGEKCVPRRMQAPG